MGWHKEQQPVCSGQRQAQVSLQKFENEIQLAHTNHALYPGIETVFLSTSLKWSYLSSTIVREAAHYNHDVSKFVTPNVEAALKKKIREGKV